jgi:hypothetical protein
MSCCWTDSSKKVGGAIIGSSPPSPSLTKSVCMKTYSPLDASLSEFNAAGPWRTALAAAARLRKSPRELSVSNFFRYL